MRDLNIALVQTTLFWEDKKSNLRKFDNIFSSIPDSTDIIIIPEMFSTGFTMSPEKFAENMSGDTFQWLKSKSKEKESIITGSVIIKEATKYYNRLIWMRPDGTFEYYDKKHLFTLTNEQDHYSGGTTKLIVEHEGWKFCPMICYDLRFPVWIRNSEDYDCLIFVANWPERRIQHWTPLLVARAIENQCYVLAVNRVGSDGNNVYHNGSSLAVDPGGKVIAMANDIETVLNITLKQDILKKIRNDLPFLNDRDNFEVKPW